MDHGSPARRSGSGRWSHVTTATGAHSLRPERWRRASGDPSCPVPSDLYPRPEVAIGEYPTALRPVGDRVLVTMSGSRPTPERTCHVEAFG